MADPPSVDLGGDLPDDRFAALLGRQLGAEDRERLVAVRKALGISSNDALWDVMIALDHHLQLYSAIPREIETQRKKLVADLSALLGERWPERAAPKGAGAGSRGDGIAGAITLGAYAIGFGALCIAAGSAIAARAPQAWGAPGLLGAVLGAPAGWLIFVLLLPMACRWVKRGWAARGSAENPKLRLLGWLVLTGSTALVVLGLWVLRMALTR